MRRWLLALAACHPPAKPAAMNVALPDPPPADAGVREADAELARSTAVRDPVAWLEQHGVTIGGDRDYAECREASVGPSREPALVCRKWEPEPVSEGRAPFVVYRDLVHTVVLAPRSGNIIHLLDLVTAIQATDFPEHFPLRLRLEVDGTIATLADGDRGCDAALAELDAPDQNKDPLSRKWQALDRRLMREACKKRGTYVWKDDRFVAK